MTNINSVEVSDADLVADSLMGNREAFGIIVKRYQTLVCSLVYSSTGNVGQSEDLAQETFVAAWKQLGNLREPHKLRSWLCQIARNLAYDTLRKQGREPIHEAAELDAVHESPALEALPIDQTISNEEQAILWRSLERIPEIYREPLVLFYRQHQSIEMVAQSLELSEDAVKQRLSRGRKLLHEQVLAFVEGALARSNPGKSFAVGVVAALPGLALPAKAASVGATAAKGTAAKTALATGWLAFAFGQLLILGGNYFGYRASLASAASDRERAHIKTFFKRNILISLAIFLPMALAVVWNKPALVNLASLFGLLPGLFVIYILVTFASIVVTCGKQRRHLANEITGRHAGDFPEPAWEYRTQTTFLGLPLVHIRIGDRFALLRGPVRAWIAIGGGAIGALFAFGGFAIAPVSVGFCSIGLFSLGAIAAGIISLGGCSLGVLAFGGLAIGWQAVGSCAIAWNAALGDVSWTHGYKVGNDETARQYIQSNQFFRSVLTFDRYWIWWNVIWVVPMAIQAYVVARKRRQAVGA